jgi:hypothetical protein
VWEKLLVSWRIVERVLLGESGNWRGVWDEFRNWLARPRRVELGDPGDAQPIVTQWPPNEIGPAPHAL